MTCEGLVMLHSDSNILTVIFPKQCREILTEGYSISGTIGHSNMEKI